MIDVFLRWYPQNYLRMRLASAVLERLGSYADIQVHGIFTGLNRFSNYQLATQVPKERFHIQSKEVANAMAQSEIYCVIDDDQLPIPNDFFRLGVAALEAHPDYGMLAGFPLEYGLQGQPYAGRTEDVIEAHAIGCPYFTRRGILSFPDGPLHQYDGILSKVVTDQGLKTGFARKCLYNHLGYGFSQVEHAKA